MVSTAFSKFVLIVLSFPPIRFTVIVCSAFSLFGKPSVEFLGYCWKSFYCICSYLFITDSQSTPESSRSALYSMQTSNKSCISSSIKKNFLPFWFKAFQLKNKLCFSTTYFIFFQKNSWYSKWEKYLSQQCFHLCRNVAFSFRHKWKQSLKWITKNELQIWISISNYFKNRKTILFYVLRLTFSVKQNPKLYF